jgi:hypothetical protein
LALPFFAVTLFVSAFLLFLVQPMIGKMILPKLGGTPQVWNTCMVFFQTALLAGYAYTHTVSTNFNVRRQLLIHCLLLFIPFAILLPWGGPFNIEGWIPPPGANPIPSTLLLLTIVVGIPFFVVATSAPLLQKWFSSTGHPAAKDPYFLYGASNLGSMLALLLYPVMVEPVFTLSGQAWFWTIGYGLLVLIMLVCALMVFQAPPSVQLAGNLGSDDMSPVPPQPAPPPTTAIKTGPAPSVPQSTGIRRGSKQRPKPAQRPLPKAVTAPITAPPRPFEMTAWKRLRWVGLAAVPSSLMLGVITFMSTDVSAIPLFWVIPLALYLLSFILVFLRWPVPWTGQPHSVTVVLHPLLLLALVWILIVPGAVSPIWRSTMASVVAFFATAMVCHGELARTRPPTRYLTEFYLWMSVGGMLGGVFNGLLAPVLFPGAWEFPIALVFAGLMRPNIRGLFTLNRPIAVMVGAGIGLFLGFVVGVLLFSGLPLKVVAALVGAVIGAGIGALHQPGERGEGWSDSWIASVFPGLAKWLDDKGDDLARNLQPPADTGAPATPSIARQDLPQRGYLLHYGLDVIMALLVGLVTGILIWGGNSQDWGWTVLPPRYRTIDLLTKNNFLIRVGYSWLGLEPNTSVSFARILGQGLMYGVPLICCFLFYGRALRFGLAIGAVLLANGLYQSTSERDLLHASRSYFGILRVHQRAEHEGPEKVHLHTYLMHGTTHHGLNYVDSEFARVATTYYHRNGPVGHVLWRMNPLFIPEPTVEDAKKSSEDLLKEKEKRITDNDKRRREWWKVFPADARMPASLFGLATADLGTGTLPMGMMVGAWSELPYGTVGLGTGTMASYARPFQHCHFYEIDDQIRTFSMNDFTLPWGTGPFFTHVRNAQKRGAELQILMGDARLRMAQPWVPNDRENDKPWDIPWSERGGPDKFYKVIELDAFSSDAIPVHLITEEAIKMYFTKLRDDGVLMVHTSNRHVDLISPVTDVAASLGLKWRVGTDRYERGGDTSKDDVNAAPESNDPSNKGRFGSGYVMLAWDEKYLPPDNTPKGFTVSQLINYRTMKEYYQRPVLWWYTPDNPGSRVWTDDYSNLLSVFRWGFRLDD